MFLFIIMPLLLPIYHFLQLSRTIISHHFLYKEPYLPNETVTCSGERHLSLSYHVTRYKTTSIRATKQQKQTLLAPAHIYHQLKHPSPKRSSCIISSKSLAILSFLGLMYEVVFLKLESLLYILIVRTACNCLDPILRFARAMPILHQEWTDYRKIFDILTFEGMCKKEKHDIFGRKHIC